MLNSVYGAKMIIISAIDIAAGQRVVVDVQQGQGRPQYYLGTVVTVGRQLFVKYDDGDEGETSRSHCWVTPIKTKNPNRILVADLARYKVHEDIMIDKKLSPKVSAPRPRTTTRAPLPAKPTLEKDPRGWATTIDLPVLIKTIVDANEKYHNGEYSGMTDHVYDAIYDVLKTRDPANKIFKQVGAPVRATRKKVALPYYMPSLTKVKPDGTAEKWLATKSSLVVMDKLDGVSIQIDVSDGLKLYTRGDGKVGQDVSHLAPALKLPPIDKIKQCGNNVRAEILLSKAAFKLFESRFENPRNLMSGLVNKLVADPILNHAHVVAYEILDKRYQKSTQLAKLKAAGFHVPVSTVVDPAFDFQKYLQQRKEKSIYDLDGLVIESNQVNKLPVSGNPMYAVSFKDEQQMGSDTTEVVTVEWNPSRGGLLKPTVIVKPVRLSGVTVRRATGFNAKYIYDNGIGPGAIIELMRSGDVIPDIVRVLQKVRPSMPDVPYTWTPTNVDIKLMDKEDPTVLVKKIAHFFRTLKVEGIAESTVQKLYDSGLNTIEKICKAKLDALSVIGQMNAKKLEQQIKDKLTNVDLATLMDASMLFGRGMGTTKMTTLVNKYPDVMDRNWDKRQAFDKALKVVGFSDTSATQFADGLELFKEFVKRIPVSIKSYAVRGTGDRLVGQTIVFTGFRDADLEARIIDNGGRIGSTVSKNTTILILKDVDSPSTKANSARALGIKLMSPSAFISTYGL